MREKIEQIAEVIFESTSVYCPNYSLLKFIRKHLPSFVSSLQAEERADLRLQLYGIAKAEFCCVARTKEKLIGIGGVMKFLGLFPGLFVVVKLPYRRKGIGDALMNMIMDFVCENCSFVILHFRYKNEPALRLYLKHEFKDFVRIFDTPWIYYCPNKKGEIICKFLPFVLMAHYFATHLRFLRGIYYKLMEYRITRALQRAILIPGEKAKVIE